MRKNFKELLIYLNELDRKNIDIVVLSETFTIEDLNEYVIEDFDIFYNNSSYNKNDGVVMYIENNLHAMSEIIELDEILMIMNFISANRSTNIYSIGVVARL